MTPTVRNATFARITFYTWEKGKIDVHDAFGAGPLVSFSTDKKLGGTAAGTWSLSLKGEATSGPNKGKAWSDLVESGDWVTIDVVKNGQTYAITAGPVDQVDVVTAAGGRGEGSITVTISGRDAGAALDDTPVYFNPWDPVHDNAAGKDMMQISLGTGSNDPENPGEFVYRLLNGFMGKDGLFGGHVKIPPGLVDTSEGYWADLVNLVSAVQEQLRGYTGAPSVVAPEGGSASVWAFIDAWRNPSMNELFVDTGPDPRDRHFYLTFRERPFVNNSDGSDSPWFTLPTADLDLGTVASVSISRGGGRVNHVTVLGELSQTYAQDAYAVYQPYADLTSVARYGLHRLEEQTAYRDTDASGNGGTNFSQEWTYLVIAWNCLNHRFWTGSIDVAEMRPDVRIGRRVRLLGGPPAGYPGLPRDGGIWTKALTFYVEGVKHTWSEGESPIATTTLTVTRGYVDGEVVADTLAAFSNFTGLVSLTPAGTVNDPSTMDAYSDESAAATGGRTA